MGKIKYPRTHHLSYSEKYSDDDHLNIDEKHFHNKNVIVSIKMDGENTTIYNEYTHARSINSDSDTEDRKWIDAFRISKIKDNIPDNYRICGENLFYKHTCHYKDLHSMFYVFSIWDDKICLSWEDTKKWCNLLNIEHVPIIYEGIYNKDIILNRFSEFEKNKNSEGFVIRIMDNFNINNFRYSVNKFVKKSFIIPNNHWRYSAKENNVLENGKNPWQIL